LLIGNRIKRAPENIQINDSAIGSVCRIGSLYNGISTTCVGVHFVSEEEFNIDRRVLFNTDVTADGVSEAIGTTLTVSRNDGSDPGSNLAATGVGNPEIIEILGSVEINYEVSNVSDATITNVRISAPQIADPVCIIPSLSAGVTASCTGILQLINFFGESLDIVATVTSDQDSVGVPVTVTLIDSAPIASDVFPPIIDPVFPDDEGSLFPTFDIVYDVNDEEDFFAAAVGINAESITVTINGGDLTADTSYDGRILTLKPTPEWPSGFVTVEVSAEDNNGNRSTRTLVM
jgi:hypothetical protein